MAIHTQLYRQQAEKCRADAEATDLVNVRDRNLRAEAAWLAMAERQERTDTARAKREAAADAERQPEQETL